MKLLELLPDLRVYGRVKRVNWSDYYLVRKVDENSPLVFCDLRHWVLKEFTPTFEELIAEDWELIK